MATRKAGAKKAQGLQVDAEAADNVPAQLPVGKRPGKKIPLVEKAVNVSATPSLEDQLASLTAKLQEVTLEKQKNEEMLKEKEARLQQSEEDRQKLKKEVQKLHKQKAFEPQLDAHVLEAFISKDNGGSECTVPGEGQETKEKSKDSRKPKHPLSAYHLWNAENYQQVKAKHPEAKMSDMSKIMSEIWKGLPESTKKTFEAKHAEQMVVYKNALAAYEQLLADERVQEEALKKLHEKRCQEEAMKLFQQFVQHNKGMADESKVAAGKKKQKDPEKPKQPVSAFLFYCSERRKTLVSDDSKRNVAEETRHFSEEWKKLSESDKSKYEALAVADRERYAVQMEAYKAKKQQEEDTLKAETEKKQKEELELAMSLIGDDKGQQNLGADREKVEATKACATKVKRGPSGYNLFCSSMREKFSGQDLSFGELSKNLGQAWKALPDGERASWNDRAQKASAMSMTSSSPPVNSLSDDFGL